MKAYLSQQTEGNEKLHNNELVTQFLNCKTADDLDAFKKKLAAVKWNPYWYNKLVGSLRDRGVL